MDNRDLFRQFHIDASLFYDAIVNSTDDYIYLVDMQSDISLISENMYLDFDLPGRLVKGLVPIWGDLIVDKDRKRYDESIARMLNGDTDEHNVEYQIRNRKGELIWIVCRGLLKRDQDGAPLLFAGMITRLENKGRIDHITGLLTQKSCIDHLAILLESGKHGSMMLLGLDDFSHINTLQNHVFGDIVLRQFAQDIQSLLPYDAQIYRYDGDQFAIVYDEADEKKTDELYQKLHAYSNHPHQSDAGSYYCTVSAGVVMIPENGNDYLDLIKYAVSALEASKQKGKNTCTFFNDDLIKQKLHQIAINEELHHNVLHQMRNFYVVYQPLLHTKTMKIQGSEALMRWKSEKFGDISPIEFIPVLESSGLIIQAGKWILEQAIATYKEWSNLIKDFVMNVNVSYLQILEDDFVETIRSLLAKYELAPEHIVIELTESYFVTDMGPIRECFSTLRKMHIRIAMDDFGSGYSSLGMLTQAPADIVKIDRSFINAIHTNPFNLSFINAVISLCHSIDIEVTVEGVEEKNELDTVCTLQADTIQGFYVSKPISKAAFHKQYITAKQ